MKTNKKKEYEDISMLLQELLEEQRKNDAESEYFANIPNDNCKYAIISKILIENSFHPIVGEWNSLFRINDERVFIWTPKKDAFSVLVSEVNVHIKDKPFWKTAGRLIQLANAFIGAFECLEEPVNYNWMYSFAPDKSKYDDIVFYELSDMEKEFLLNTGRIYKATKIAALANIIELLNRDDKAYDAISFVKEAFEMHWCCLLCELSQHPFHDHRAEEPEIWNQADMLPKLESSIVQSCRAVESILGEPPNQAKLSSVTRHKEKWKNTLGLNPDEYFEKAQKTYLDFYYELFFSLRNPSAHSYGDIHYDLQRKKAVEAQCFAAIILQSYIEKNKIDDNDAKKKLEFNQEFLSRVSADMSTPITEE